MFNAGKYLKFFLPLLFIFGLEIAIGAGVPSINSCGIRSAHYLATQAGCDVLEKGGNAFDAAVAVTSALAVVEPFSSGIGGGGFYLLKRANSVDAVFLDAREKAPAKANPSVFVKNGQVIKRLSLDGPTAAAIPGIPAALEYLSDNYGKLRLADTMEASIQLAQEGFEVDERYVKLTNYRINRLKNDTNTSAIFLDGGELPKVGWTLKQLDLAETLRKISIRGAREFYFGSVGKEIFKSIKEGGGLWEKSDLESYAIEIRKPVELEFMGAKIISAPLPSSGGLVIAQALQIIENHRTFDMDQTDFAHLVIEAMRRGYSDRAIYMGDPDFTQAPIETLLSPAYASKRYQDIDMNQASDSRNLSEGHFFINDSAETTHFSIVDAQGNQVAATLSINGLYGAAFTGGSTGVLLNNHMNDFVLGPGIPNLYGLVGTEANLVGPNKRPLSSMSPTFVEDERGVLIIGTPGGSRIISMVIQGILDYLSNEEISLERIVAKPRYHHQFIPDRVEVEPTGFNEDFIQGLTKKGHKIKVGSRRWGNMQVIFFNKETGEIFGASDPRGQ